MARSDDKIAVYCSFCGKRQDQVHRMLAGMDGAFICDACVNLCSEIIEEEDELMEDSDYAQEQGINLTTSCCPAFLNMARIHFPSVYEKNMSTTVSPMVALARYMKKKDPELKVCFIGPCVAKKQEAQLPGTETDYVLSYQELAAMLVSQHIYPMDVAHK